jgi:hypothetical protein
MWQRTQCAFPARVYARGETADAGIRPQAPAAQAALIPEPDRSALRLRSGQALKARPDTNLHGEGKMPSHPSEPKTLAGDPRPSGQPAGRRRYGGVSPGAQNQCPGRCFVPWSTFEMVVPARSGYER